MTHEERLSDAGQLYVGIVIAAGVVAVLHSLYTLHSLPLVINGRCSLASLS